MKEIDPRIIPYGQKIGAALALIKNDVLQHYYKKGNKASKWCWYAFGANKYGRPLLWVSSGETCIYRVAEFYRNLGHTIDLVEIPEKLIEESDKNETE